MLGTFESQKRHQLSPSAYIQAARQIGHAHQLLRLLRALVLNPFRLNGSTSPRFLYCPGGAARSPLTSLLHPPMFQRVVRVPASWSGHMYINSCLACDFENLRIIENSRDDGNRHRIF